MPPPLSWDLGLEFGFGLDLTPEGQKAQVLLSPSPSLSLSAFSRLCYARLNMIALTVQYSFMLGGYCHHSKHPPRGGPRHAGPGSCFLLCFVSVVCLQDCIQNLVKSSMWQRTTRGHEQAAAVGGGLLCDGTRRHRPFSTRELEPQFLQHFGLVCVGRGGLGGRGD